MKFFFPILAFFNFPFPTILWRKLIEKLDLAKIAAAKTILLYYYIQFQIACEKSQCIVTDANLNGEFFQA